MAPEERREVLVDVTLRLLREHGRAVTTRQIAEAAGVAEGTIFRVVDSKDELVDAAIARAFEPGDVEARILEIDPGLPLRERLVRLASIIQQRHRATFALMTKVGFMRPPDHDGVKAQAWRARAEELILGVLGDPGQFRAPAPYVAHVFRLVSFAGSHDQIADGSLLTPEQIVEVVLDGLGRDDDAC